MTLYNITLLPASDLTSASTEEIAALRSDMNIGIEPGVGTLKATAGKALTLDIQLDETNPNWVEMNWISGGDVLCRHPHVVLRLAATSQHPSWVHPALRLHREDGFKDVFPDHRIHLHEINDNVHEVSYNLNPRQVEGCYAIDLQIFFEPRPNSITLHSLSLTAFK